jgi:hypothetical protein
MSGHGYKEKNQGDPTDDAGIELGFQRIRSGFPDQEGEEKKKDHLEEKVEIQLSHFQIPEVHSFKLYH